MGCFQRRFHGGISYLASSCLVTLIVTEKDTIVLMLAKLPNVSRLEITEGETPPGHSSRQSMIDKLRRAVPRLECITLRSGLAVSMWMMCQEASHKACTS